MMRFYTLFLILFLGAQLNAQIARDSSSLSVEFTPSNKEHKFQIHFTNTADTSVYLHWILTKNSRAWVDCWDTNFCDINLCYADNVDSSVFENEIFPGEFVFELGIKDNNCGGSALLGLQLFTDAAFQNEIYCMTINVNNSTEDINFCTSSVSDESLADVRMYPNPVNQYLHIEGELVKNVDIFSVMGHPVYHSDMSATGRFDVSHLSSGLYIVRLTSQTQHTKSFKFFKE
jgi:hypothetical protein